jgi:hypothetical protein
MSIHSTGLSNCESEPVVKLKRDGDPAVKPKPTRLPDLKVALAVRPKIAWNMLDCGNTRGYELIASGELDSFLDGRSRKVTVESIHRYIARRLALANKGVNANPQPRRRKRPLPNESDARF